MPCRCALVSSSTLAPTRSGLLPTLRRVTSASACPPLDHVMWCDSFSRIAVGGSPSDDLSELVSSSIRLPDAVCVCNLPGSIPYRCRIRLGIIALTIRNKSFAWLSEFAASCTSDIRRGLDSGRSPSQPTNSTGPTNSIRAIDAPRGSLPTPLAPRFTPDRYSHFPSPRIAYHRCKNRRCPGVNRHGCPVSGCTSHCSAQRITTGPSDGGSSSSREGCPHGNDRSPGHGSVIHAPVSGSR